MEGELPLIGATQGQDNWLTKGLVGSRSTQRNWTEGWTTVKSVAQEGRKVKPILPTTPSCSTDRKTSRTNLTGLKPAEDFFFSFLLSPWIPSSFLSFFLFFYSFFLPSFTFLFLLPAFFYLLFCFNFCENSLSCLQSFFIPSSFLLFIFYSLFSSFHSPFFSPFLFFSQVRQENLECWKDQS